MEFKLIFILWIKLFISCQENDNNPSYINLKDFSIKNAIYIIRNREGNVNLELNPEIAFINNPKIPLKQSFEIVENKQDNYNSELFYFIKNKEGNISLSAQKNNTNLTKYTPNIDIDYALWKITYKINEDNKLIYYVQNKKTGYYWELNSNNKLNLRYIPNGANLTKANEFLFIELYENVKIKESKLLEDEPIDVLIKYLDLNDEKLNRSGIKLISKDYENGEIKYCVRSILQNIPWIRKIFILMPNEEVKYFLPKEKISEKIVYVKDKDLLGFESEDIYLFQYNLHKMRQFGLSENFVLMDDDYFIGKPINKNEMFYEENGQIYPAIVASEYYEMDRNSINEDVLKLKPKNLDPHSPDGFRLTQKNSKLFSYDIFGNDEIRFGKKLIEPSFTHNAFPAKLSDIEELYNYLYNNDIYRNTFLKTKERTIDDPEFHTMYWCYAKNKYGRKTFVISSDFYDVSTQPNRILANTKKLFVINTSSRNYNKMFFEREKEVLEKYFPIKTKYESDNIELINKREKINKIIIDALIKNTFNKEIMEQINLIHNSIKAILNNNLQNHLDDVNDYKNMIAKEIKDLSFQCFWHEILNGIFLIIFIILIVFRFKDNRIKNRYY